MDWISTRVVARQAWAEGLFSLKIDTEIDFEPGQFTNLAMDLDGKRLRRSYSIASGVNQPLEFYVTEVAGGALSPSLSSLRAGDEIFVQSRGAGVLTLSFVPEFAKELWLVSTGTGLAPYVSMLRSGVLFPRFERVVFAHGVRECSHLGYAEELRAAAAADPRVSYVPLVTRETPPEGGLPERITAAIESGSLEKAAGLSFDVDKTHMMLCGNPEMVKSSIAALIERGFRKHKRREPGHITMEKYW